MRLLKTASLEFIDIYREEDTHEYAILSHTWGKEEVTYKDMLKRRAQAESKEGFQKIVYCAKQAVHDRIEYCWVDSCCIDKSSSAELSESINSMFIWYRNAAVCYTYLGDVPAKPEEASPERQHEWMGVFKKSRWFTRGWTLQEMVAPRHLIFYSDDWTRIDTKAVMVSALQAVTGVPTEVLLSGDPSTSSVAQRMSWAAHRQTSRREDIAYCLMGIFDVNMAMLYGEGSKAFLRLQEEILRTSDDRSIFAWCDPKASFATYRGLLAQHPSEFAQCKNVTWTRKGHQPYQSTNMGIHLDLQLISRQSTSTEFIAPLFGVENCALGTRVCVGIYLQQVGANQYARVQLDQLALFQSVLMKQRASERANPFIRQRTIMEDFTHSRAGGIRFRILAPNWALSGVHPPDKWEDATALFRFAKPLSEADPPCALFAMKDATTSATLTIRVDACRAWGEFVSVDESGWRTQQQTASSSTHTVYCRKPGQAAAVVTVQRGLTDNESWISVDVNEHTW